MEVYIAGQRHILQANELIGKGGEADVYRLGNDKVLKIFKGADHPDFAGQPAQQQAAKQRLAIYQKKLPHFPRGLPRRVIVPEAMATDRSGKKILGYAMQFITDAEVLARYADQDFRSHGSEPNIISDIFKDLLATIKQIHNQQVVIGDFNDLNVLVKGNEGYFIDADSFQFNGFLCPVFTAKFVDPLICQVVNGIMLPKKEFSRDTDWYSFAVMLMECLLFVNPYGGVYRPKDPGHRVNQTLRPMERITIFHPEVRYPKNAVKIEALPDTLTHYFHQVFEKDKRGDFPERILQDLRWVRCSQCGMEHARSTCPHCLAATPVRVKGTMTVRGKVTARRLFATTGRILNSKIESGRLLWLYHENDGFYREDQSRVFDGKPELGMRFRLLGTRTFVGYRDTLLEFKAGDQVLRLNASVCDGYPQFATNEEALFWQEANMLYREGDVAPDLIGEVLGGGSKFWVGSNFGFGYYRAAHMQVGFVFNAKGVGISDHVDLPRFRGKLVETNCFISDKLCWFFAIMQENGRLIQQCTVVRADGEVIASLQEEETDRGWLKHVTGKCAVGQVLLAITDSGIVRLDVVNGQITETTQFPDTEPFIHQNCSLLPGKDGLYIVDTQTITMLQIA